MIDELRTLRTRGVYFGTSSWKYPGWQGWFYKNLYRSQKAFNENCLSEYAETFPAVGVDHTYYDWPKPKVFAHYAAQTPAHFRFGLKATERITVFRYPKLARYGKDAGTTNPDFLNPDAFAENFLKPLEEVRDRIGTIMLEFSQFHAGMLESGREFIQRLDTFFEKLGTTGHAFSVEIRNRGWLQPEYFQTLAKHDVSHVFNSWTKMPSLQEQLELAKGHALSSIVSRVLLQPGTKYEDAVEAFSPYDRVMEEHSALRASIADLVQRAVELKLPAYIFVNNRAEGCAPKTIDAVLKLLRQRSFF